ncbi:MAG: ABC transporter substrate-binding protein [Chloroflexi bacterium]|nr:ABC transporter substrate-binding protein [Chloroflexota bacterium]
MVAAAKRTLQLGHSPDSDDAFMFHGLASGQVSSGDLEFEHILKDIQTLNQWAMQGRLEITAVSVHAYAYIWQRYAVLTHGASMGRNYGPMLVTQQAIDPKDLRGRKIAIPGKLTSAYLGLRLFLPEFDEVVVPFDTVMDEVEAGRADAGLLIHEGQLTHGERGLVKVWDMGEWWQAQTGLPLPLGINVVRKDVGPALMARISRLLKASIAYGLEHRQEALDYALQFARGMERTTADTFVGMYVNDLTLDMGDEGKLSIQLLLERGHAARIIPTLPHIEWVD